MKRALDHHVWKILKANDLQKKKFLVALSGGADSAALLRVLKKVAPHIEAAYFHHGPAEKKSQTLYRDRAGLFCEKICQELEIPFHFLKTKKSKSQSEEALRKKRYQALDECLVANNLDLLVLGHHSDDLLETRLLRLIRGTGAQGLGAMSNFKGKLLRPFLEVSKQDLVSYLKAEKQTYFEDPSNASIDPLRNWLRKDWLPRLERKQKGSLKSFSRSLQTLASEKEEKSLADLLEKNETYLSQDFGGGLVRSFYLSLNRAEQKRLLAQYLLSLGKKDFGQSHLEEICKRLDNPQKVITFRVAQLEWVVNAEQIKVLFEGS